MQQSPRDTDVGRFGRWAAKYNDSLLQRLIFAPVQEFILEEAARTLPHPEAILDIGCGTGLLLQRAARRFPAAQLTGIDPAEEMIRVARSSTPDGASARFVHGFAEELPFADATFDLVFTTMSFHHWGDQASALREVRRVLAPGGAFALADGLPVGWLHWLLARSGDGRFNDPATLAVMVRVAGLRPERLVPMRRFDGVVKVAIARAPRD
jgi:ubiquinone/menaquinone biosynthesis C-methylase UbiE